MLRVFMLVFLMFSHNAYAINWQDSPVVTRLFSEYGVQGTFVLHDVSTGTFTGHDRTRAETRFIPASTFKIPNSLIGLSTGAVESIDEVLPYGGKPQPYKAWEQDMNLREAIKVSNVPIYQELARRVGLARMKDNVSKLNYGSGEIGKVVDDFWLEGPLKISAVEQTQFLARLATDTLPLSKDIQAKVREMLELEHGENGILYGKTGSVFALTPNIGWWVGWVKNADRLHVFALNIDMSQPTDAAKRLDLGKACLKALL